MPGHLRQRVGHAKFDLFLAGSNLVLRLPGHAFRAWYLRTVANFEIGARCAIQRGVRLRSRGGVRIGEGTNINHDVLLDGGGGLTIGSRVNISPEVLLLTTEHDPNSPSFGGRSRPVSVGDRVWLASRAIVLPGATIGEGALVGAGAVVRGRVEPWSIVAGNPARVVGQRDRGAQSGLETYRRFLH